jgi:hypothetical protein
MAAPITDIPERTPVMLRPTKKFVVAGGLVAGMMASGIAWAAWTADGTGSGYAGATTAEALTTSPATASADLYPGSTGDVTVTINNPNDYAVNVTSITGNGTITDDKAACTVTGVTFATQTGTWNVAANASSTVTLADAASMSNASDTGCQGAVFTIPVALSGASAA